MRTYSNTDFSKVLSLFIIGQYALISLGSGKLQTNYTYPPDPLPSVVTAQKIL